MPLISEIRVPNTPEGQATLALYLHQFANQQHIAPDQMLHIVEQVSAIMSDFVISPSDSPADETATTTVEYLVRLEMVGGSVNQLSISLRRAIVTDASDTIEQTVEPTVAQFNVTRQLTTGKLASAEQELSAMQAISEVLTSNIHLDDLLRMIIIKLVEILDAERGTLYLLDEERGELYSKVLLEDTNLLHEIRIGLDEGIAGHVATTGKITNTPDVNQDPRYLRKFDVGGFQSRNLLTVPMRNPQQKIIGVVQLLNKRGGAFTTHDERMLVAMASQAAIGIETSRLYEEELEQQLLEKELATAQSIQRSFLSSKIPTHADWELVPYWEPAREVAGDFYMVHPLGATHAAVVIADVCGKGVPAALFMALSVTVLRFGIQLDFSPMQLLHHANNVILTYNEESRMFASVFAAEVDFETGLVQYASAGHNPPLLFRQATQSFELLQTKGILVGLFDNAVFHQAQTYMNQHDVLVMYTDGVTEAMNANDEEYGVERLQQMIATHAHRTADELRWHVLEDMAAFVGETAPHDDVTLVLVKRTGVAATEQRKQREELNLDGVRSFD